MTSILLQKVDEITLQIKLPFQARPLTESEIKIPYTVKEVAGLKLKKFGKTTAIESGILSAFRSDLITQVTRYKTQVAELMNEMSVLLGVDSLEELGNFLGDADALLAKSREMGLEGIEAQDWVDRFVGIVGTFNTDQTKLLMDLNLITFIIAFRGEDPDWDYSDTYSQLTSEDHESILDFLYVEEGLNSQEEALVKK